MLSGTGDRISRLLRSSADPCEGQGAAREIVDEMDITRNNMVLLILAGNNMSNIMLFRAGVGHNMAKGWCNFEI